MKGCRPLEMPEVRRALELLRGKRLAVRDRTMFLLGMCTGFRISELLSLRVGDVLRNGRLLDEVVVERRHMKGKRESRAVDLNADAKAALKQWLPVLFDWRGAGDDLFLFQSTKGGRITRQQAWRIVAGVAKQLQLPPKVGTHSLRKTFGTEIYLWELNNWKPGMELPVRIAQKALGHASVETTERYLGLDVQRVRAAVHSLNYTGGAG